MSNDKLAEALREVLTDINLVKCHWCKCHTWCSVEDACKTLAEHEAHAAEAAHEGSLLTGTTPDGKHYGLRGSKESVDTISDMLIIAEAAQAQAQSDDWVVVPREPTEWMLQAAEDAVNASAHCESTTDDLSAIAYKAALAAAPQPQPAQDAALYQELLMAVSKKFPNESRHETALRYIKQTELQSCEPKCDDAIAKESGR